MRKGNEVLPWETKTAAKLMTSVIYVAGIVSFFIVWKEIIMLTSLALIFLLGLFTARLCQRLRLPRLVGMLLTGILLGPFVLDLLDPAILDISDSLRQMALIIILLKAGLTLDINDLKQVGRPAILLAFIPAVFEIIAYALAAPRLLGLARTEAALMGSVLAAVSPAVVVPLMVRLIDENRGTKKSIPQMILAGASLDDVLVIVLFTTLLGLNQGDLFSPLPLLDIPVSVLSGLLGGAIIGWVLAHYFEAAYAKGKHIRNSVKLIIILSLSFLMLTLESALRGSVPFSGLLAVMSLAVMLQRISSPIVSKRLSAKFGKLWLAAELILFVLVGAAVDIRYTLTAGLTAIGLIAIGLAFRSLGVALSLIGTPLNRNERLFCIIAYLPKATVQAAIGSVPLALGLPSGKIILSVAVMAILITAPLGALGMEATHQKWLVNDDPNLIS